MGSYMTTSLKSLRHTLPIAGTHQYAQQTQGCPAPFFFYEVSITQFGSASWRGRCKRLLKSLELLKEWLMLYEDDPPVRPGRAG